MNGEHGCVTQCEFRWVLSMTLDLKMAWIGRGMTVVNWIFNHLTVHFSPLKNRSSSIQPSSGWKECYRYVVIVDQRVHWKVSLIAAQLCCSWCYHKLDVHLCFVAKRADQHFQPTSYSLGCIWHSLPHFGLSGLIRWGLNPN